MSGNHAEPVNYLAGQFAFEIQPVDEFYDRAFGFVKFHSVQIKFLHMKPIEHKIAPMSKTVKLAAALCASYGAGLIGSIFTRQSVESWYQTLEKPMLTPPSWVFSPVWILLYTLMGISAYIVWRHTTVIPRVRLALTLFAVQLVLNALWSFIFFGLKAPYAAFFELLLLWLFMVATTYHFWRISIWSGILMVPYHLWVMFAAYLNYGIWLLN